MCDRSSKLPERLAWPAFSPTARTSALKIAEARNPANPKSRNQLRPETNPIVHPAAELLAARYRSSHERCERHLPKPRKPETPTPGNPEILKSDLTCSYGETGRRVSALATTLHHVPRLAYTGRDLDPEHQKPEPKLKQYYRQRPLMRTSRRLVFVGFSAPWTALKQKRGTVKTRKPESGEYRNRVSG